MSDYLFGGLNLWKYSDNRAIAWIGRRGSHYSDKRRHLTYQRGQGGALGVFVTVGGEDREVMLRLELLFASFYIGLTNIVNSDEEKLAAASQRQKLYRYELDFANEGRETGAMISFRGESSGLFASLWLNPQSWSSRAIVEKFRDWPYCEGVGCSFYFDRLIGWKHYSVDKTSKPESHPYRYTLKSGETQDRIATITAERRERRRFGFFKKVVHSIDVCFDGEVGERSGSWKGGTIGCGYELLDGESPLECLRRMERDRQF